MDEHLSEEEVMVTTQVPCTTKKNEGIVPPIVADEDIFFRDIDYRVSRTDLDIGFTLSTRFDTASKVSFMKESLIPIETIESINYVSVKYFGLNRSLLVVKRMVKLDIIIDGDMQRNIEVFIVPDTTMHCPIMLGRQAFARFEFRLTRPIDNAVSEIFNIEIDSSANVCEALQVNNKLPLDTQDRVKQLFEVNYFNASRPAKPKVDMTLELQLQKRKPFNFALSRLSFF